MTYSISPGWPPIHPCPWVLFSVARCNPPTSTLRRLQALTLADVESGPHITVEGGEDESSNFRLIQWVPSVAWALVACAWVFFAIALGPQQPNHRLQNYAGICTRRAHGPLRPWVLTTCSQNECRSITVLRKNETNPQAMGFRYSLAGKIVPGVQMSKSHGHIFQSPQGEAGTFE